jgi:hypothetical protein
LVTSGFSLIHATWTLASPPLNASRAKLSITGTKRLGSTETVYQRGGD